MHKKKKEQKKRGIGWTILRIFLGAAGALVLVLVVYIGYLFVSYHRIEDNLELEVEKSAVSWIALAPCKCTGCLRQFRLLTGIVRPESFAISSLGNVT